MPPEPLDIRTGPAYEADRAALLSRLAETAEHLRVELGHDLVVVFATAESLRAALEELARAERVGDGDRDRLAAEAAAFADLAPGPARLAATLLVDITDPVALGDRLAELAGLADRVSLNVGGDRVPASPTGAAADGSGAVALLFEPDERQRGILLAGGELAVVVDHPACHLRVALSAEQVRAVTADLRA